MFDIIKLLILRKIYNAQRKVFYYKNKDYILKCKQTNHVWYQNRPQIHCIDFNTIHLKIYITSNIIFASGKWFDLNNFYIK